MLKKIILIYSLLSCVNPVFATVFPGDISVGNKLPATEINQVRDAVREDKLPINASNNYSTETENLGSNTYKWANLYVVTANVRDLVISGTIDLDVVTKNADYTLDKENVILVDDNAGDVTINMPLAGNKGRIYTIVKISTGDNKIIIDGAGTETINNNLLATLFSRYSYIKLMDDGSNWVVIKDKIARVLREIEIPTYSYLSTSAGTTWTPLGGFYDQTLAAYDLIIPKHLANICDTYLRIAVGRDSTAATSFSARINDSVAGVIFETSAAIGGNLNTDKAVMYDIDLKTGNTTDLDLGSFYEQFALLVYLFLKQSIY